MASQQAPKKRPMEEMAGYEVADRVYRFKILLPNGTSVGLAVRDPEPRMEFWDFIKLIKDEYYASLRQNQFMKKRRPINWYSEKLLLEDANDKKTRTRINFENFKPLKCHIIRLHNMWDLTPDTDLLMELPEEYTFETALADLMDNSLQAVWSNDKHGRRLIRVDVSEGRISIFDTGSGMDGSDENSMVKWGKIGASLHRSSKAQGIGGKPPYLMPCFGMFGYGGAIASMHLGRHALVSSKTKSSKKVYTLHLEREALLSQNNSGVTWRTDGSLRDPSEDEIGLSPQGSFTKVLYLGVSLWVPALANLVKDLNYGWSFYPYDLLLVIGKGLVREKPSIS
ncbi:uncharacterized protein LOC110823351 isoform X2 [Carica papaya]|uniref:uncharacterized protein LOC110823351 isoform X2 n=1 Tax=Carica papaya TaxID=3649 RepID=UPI000B8CF0FE|nr:uncharacterized protein LOC110823351 isoform X2 [Carica papaya]